MMKKVFILTFIVVFWVSHVFADSPSNLPVESHQETAVSEVEAVMIDLVNLARFYPLLVAEALGLDHETLFSDIPANSTFWEKHKWGLRSNESLNTAASMHVSDMLAGDYFDFVSFEGKNIEQRAVDANYRILSLYENMAVIAFQNYISPQQAGLEIFKQFFLDEVHSFKAGKPNIFEHGPRDIGVSFQGGKLTLGGKLSNVYLFVVVYGISQNVYTEELLMRFINLSRIDPMQTLDEFKIDRADASKALDGFLLIGLQGGLSSLMFYSSQRDLMWLGYDEYPLKTMENQSLTWQEQVDGDADHWEIASILFEKLMALENMKGIKYIFSPWSNAGIIKLTQEETSEGIIYEVKLTLNYLIHQPNMVSGNVFLDISNDYTFRPEQGLENMDLFIKDSEGRVLYSTVSGPLGSFRMEQHFGAASTLEVWSGNDLLYADFFTALNKNHFNDIAVSQSEKQ